MNYGKPPKTGWAPLAPEILVADIDASLSFWIDILGFCVAYARPAEKFAYLERPEGAQVMLCQRSGKWETGPLEAPFGRGVMFQVRMDDPASVLAALERKGLRPYAGPREVWRNVGDRQLGMREVFVQDPDGYLIMMASVIGERSLS